MQAPGRSSEATNDAMVPRGEAGSWTMDPAGSVVVRMGGVTVQDVPRGELTVSKLDGLEDEALYNSVLLTRPRDGNALHARAASHLAESRAMRRALYGGLAPVGGDGIDGGVHGSSGAVNPGGEGARIRSVKPPTRSTSRNAREEGGPPPATTPSRRRIPPSTSWVSGGGQSASVGV